MTTINDIGQELLKLLWTVRSEGKLQSCLELRNFQNPFTKDNSVGLPKTYHAQKRPKICTCCRVSKAKFYLYHSTKIAKARPGFDDQPEHPSVQINSSSPFRLTLFYPLLMKRLI